MDRNFIELLPWGGWGASLSARRAWIEIVAFVFGFGAKLVSLSARRAWIEMSNLKHTQPAEQSLSARRAWIEICQYQKSAKQGRRRSPQGERG